MAAQQTPVENQDLRPDMGTRVCFVPRLLGRNRGVTRNHSRRHGLVRVQFRPRMPDDLRSRRMTPAAPHISVLGREAVEMLNPRDGGIYVDATFGAGGYSRLILAVPGTRVIGIDRDRSAIAGGFDLVD